MLQSFDVWKVNDRNHNKLFMSFKDLFIVHCLGHALNIRMITSKGFVLRARIDYNFVEGKRKVQTILHFTLHLHKQINVFNNCEPWRRTPAMTRIERHDCKLQSIAVSLGGMSGGLVLGWLGTSIFENFCYNFKLPKYHLISQISHNIIIHSNSTHNHICVEPWWI